MKIKKIVIKKLIGIVVLSLLLSGNAYSNDIKIKRIECDNKFSDDRFYNYFFVILNNDKYIKMFKSNYSFSWETQRFDIEAGLNFISLRSSGNLEYQINRANGELWSFKEVKVVGTCSKMEDGFNPEAFLSRIVEKNIAEEKEKNIF